MERRHLIMLTSSFNRHHCAVDFKLKSKSEGEFQAVRHKLPACLCLRVAIASNEFEKELSGIARHDNAFLLLPLSSPWPLEHMPQYY